MRIFYSLMCPNKKLAILVFAVLLTVVVSSCNDSSQAGMAERDKSEIGDQVFLTLAGFNYTDHHISSYSVDGAWGGDIAVSGPKTGGSKSTCCVRWVVGQELPVTVHIRWQSDSCTYEKVVDGETFTQYKPFYSEADVQITQAAVDDPEYFETHFYPDGHVEVAVTDQWSKPRLDLPVKGGVRGEGPRRRPRANPIKECTPEQMEESNDDPW